jgi:hypothetical protein
VCRANADHQWANALLRIIHFDQAMRSRIATYVMSDLREGLRAGIFAYEKFENALGSPGNPHEVITVAPY